MFTTTMTVPTRHLTELTRRLHRAGFTVHDTGERIATDEGIDAEATLRVVAMPLVELVDPESVPLGVSA